MKNCKNTESYVSETQDTELSRGISLDIAVAEVEGIIVGVLSPGENAFLVIERDDDDDDDEDDPYGAPRIYKPSTDWATGGPIIERYAIQVERGIDGYVAYTNSYWWDEADGGTECRCETTVEGGTYLEAAMRCYVASKRKGELP